MPPKISAGIEQLQQLRGTFKMSQETSLVDIKPSIPEDLTALQRVNNIVFQWKVVSGVDGYDLALATDKDLANPEFIVRIPGSKNINYPFYTGNRSITYNGWIRSYLGQEASEFSELVSGTSIASSQIPGDSSLDNSTFDDTETTILSKAVTMSCPGGMLLGYIQIDADASVNDVTIRLKRDGNFVNSSDFSTRTDGFSHGFVMATVGSLTVGDSITFSLTADNVTDTDTITVDGGILLFLNSPISLDAAIPEASPFVVFDDIIRPGGGGFK